MSGREVAEKQKTAWTHGWCFFFSTHVLGWHLYCWTRRSIGIILLTFARISGPRPYLLWLWTTAATRSNEKCAHGRCAYTRSYKRSDMRTRLIILKSRISFEIFWIFFTFCGRKRLFYFYFPSTPGFRVFIWLCFESDTFRLKMRCIR